MKTTKPAAMICGIILTTVFSGGIAFAQRPQAEHATLFPAVMPREQATIQKTVTVALLSLAQARADIHRKAYTQARHQLDEAERLARSNLEKAAKSGNKREQQEAGRLSGEVAAFEGRLNSRETGADLALQGIWGRTKALAERSAEYLAAGWDTAETTLREDNNLIEAKLHAGYAETYQITEREPDKAAEELGKADSYLKKALRDPLADNAARTSIRGLDKDILALKDNPERNDIRTQDRYESITGRLSNLIQRIYLGNLEQKMSKSE